MDNLFQHLFSQVKSINIQFNVHHKNIFTTSLFYIFLNWLFFSLLYLLDSVWSTFISFLSAPIRPPVVSSSVVDADFQTRVGTCVYLVSSTRLMASPISEPSRLTKNLNLRNALLLKPWPLTPDLPMYLRCIWLRSEPPFSLWKSETEKANNSRPSSFLFVFFLPAHVLCENRPTAWWIIALLRIIHAYFLENISAKMHINSLSISFFFPPPE